MSVDRNKNQAGEVVNPKHGVGKHSDEAVNEAVNAFAKEVYDGIRLNPGIRKPQLLKIVKASRSTVERAIVKLRESHKIEFRGAPKTGGYHCIA